MSENMKIWNQVCKTDPKYTKQVNKGSGFTITAIDAQSQIMKATELFGVFGIAWGVKDEHFDFKQIGDDVMVLYQAIMYIPDGLIPLHSTLIINRETRSGRRVDDECFKKVATDALTKGLSKLGFNADVFLGLFDDNRYVAERRREEAAKSAPVTDPVTDPVVPPKPKQNKAQASEKLMEVGALANKLEPDQEKRRKMIAEILCDKCVRWNPNKPEDITMSVLMQNVRNDEYDLVIEELKKRVGDQ